MESSKFSFSIVSTGRRPAKTSEPELTLTTTKGKFKLNEALTRMMKLQHGDYVSLVNNESSVLEAIEAGDAPEGTPVTWGLVKGYPVLDAKGNVKQVKSRLTGETEDKHMGFKLASLSKNAGIGLTLEGGDSANYIALGGVPEESVIYKVSTEPVLVEMDGEDREVYLLGESYTAPQMRKA